MPDRQYPRPLSHALDCEGKRGTPRSLWHRRPRAIGRSNEADRPAGLGFPCAILGLVTENELPLEISPQEVQRKIDAGEPLVLIDVREPEEFAVTRLEGATLIPMRNIPASLQELEAKADDNILIIVCHHGVRSLNVVSWLRNQGISACQSMAGGIDLWSVAVDPSVPRY
jgi:rhodanese-related sulfurtransferase